MDISDQLIIMVLHQGYWENEASFYCISFCAKKKGILSMIFLLTASDLVSLHCALTNDTTHILNAERLQHIKPGEI